MLEKKLREYLLNDAEELRDVVNEINGWNGNLDWLEFRENNEEFFELFYSGINGLEIARAIYYGDYNYNDDYVRINAYGNLVSYTEYGMIEEIKDSIDEIVDRLIELKDNIFITTKEQTICDLLIDGEFRILMESLESYIDENNDLDLLYKLANKMNLITALDKALKELEMYKNEI